MRIKDIFLIVCVVLAIIGGILYIVLDMIFSFGLVKPKIDIRKQLIIIEYLLTFIILFFLIISIRKNKH